MLRVESLIMKGSAPHFEPSFYMDTEKLITEARAKIIWGEPAESVRDFLTSNGMAGPEADEQIKAFNLERNREIRKMGIKDTLIGAVLTGISGGLIYFMLTRSEMPHFTTRAGKGLGVLMLGAGYGLWKLVNGIVYLVRPQSEHQSITELEE
jgi:hypothetical protein